MIFIKLLISRKEFKVNKKWNYSNDEWEKLLHEEKKEPNENIGKVFDLFLVLIVVAILVFR